MRIIVIGSGKLGYQIAEALSREKYDLVVIDSDSDVIERTHRYSGCSHHPWQWIAG